MKTENVNTKQTTPILLDFHFQISQDKEQRIANLPKINKMQNCFPTEKKKKNKK